ncbi:MAG: PepSY domain-containing protein [Bacteroidetes bacterium]|nr:PepSY domain-containing protein [Bacteroidota bacterium]
MKPARYNRFVWPVLLAVTVGCQSGGPSVGTSPAEPRFPYPAVVRMDPSGSRLLSQQISQLLTAEGASYQVVRIDSLSAALSSLEYGSPGIRLFGDTDSSRPVTGLEAGFRQFIDRYSNVFQVKSGQLQTENITESYDFTEFTFRKSFPSLIPFINPEINTIQVVISRFGEVGMLRSTVLPDRPMISPEWVAAEEIRKNLVQHKIDYMKDGKNQVYVIQSADQLSSGDQQALVVYRRRTDVPGQEMTPASTEIRYHYVWKFDVFVPTKPNPQFRIFADATTGEVLESRFIGGN